MCNIGSEVFIRWRSKLMWRLDLSFPEQRGLVANLIWRLKSKSRHVFNQQAGPGGSSELEGCKGGVNCIKICCKFTLHKIILL